MSNLKTEEETNNNNDDRSVKIVIIRSSDGKQTVVRPLISHYHNEYVPIQIHIHQIHTKPIPDNDTISSYDHSL